MHKAACTQFSNNLQSFTDQLYNEYLVELPANLDSLFHKINNTTSTPIGVEGEEPQSGGTF